VKAESKARLFNLDSKLHQKDFSGWSEGFRCKDNEIALEKVAGYTKPKVDELLSQLNQQFG
jgi:hypothetical protein